MYCNVNYQSDIVNGATRIEENRDELANLQGFTVTLNHPREYKTIALVVLALMKKDYKQAAEIIDEVAAGYRKIEKECWNREKKFWPNGREDAQLPAIVTQEENLLQTLKKLFMNAVKTEMQPKFLRSFL